MSYIANSDWNKCTACGDCLVKCPVLKMERKEAQNAIKNLIAGKDSPRVFSECTYCFNCNNYCPVEGLRPHELILQRTIEKRKKTPGIFKYISNGRSTPNLFKDIYREMNPEEKKILDKWGKIPGPSKEVLWVGCIGKVSCFDIENSKVLADLPKYGPRDLCCGEVAYRLDSYENYAKTIERTLEKFAQLDVERMVCYCGSCYNYLSNVLPNVYGRKLPFKLVSMYQWMWERIEKGELSLKKPLKFTAAVHESCYVSQLEADFPEILRKLYNASGVTTLELKHHGKQNLSCGAVSIVKNTNPFKTVFKEQHKKYHEVHRAGADSISVNCPGCYLTMSFTNRFYRKKLRYMPEELLSAYGDNITKPLGKRNPFFIKTVIKNSPKLLKRMI